MYSNHKNQKIGDNKYLISQTEKNNNNFNKNINTNMENNNTRKKEENLDFFSNFKNLDSQLIHKKRKPPMQEKKEEEANKLNENEIHEALYKSILLMEHEIEEKKNKKIKLEEDIQKIQKELDELNEEIKKYEKIKNSNLLIINNLYNNEIGHEGKNEIKKFMNNNKEENEVNLFSFNQSFNLKSKQFENNCLNKYEENKVNLFISNQNLNLKSEQFLNNSNNFSKEINEPTILQTEIIQTEKENSGNKSPNINQDCENTYIILKKAFNHKFANEKTIHKIEQNKNRRNTLEGTDQYSFRWLTKDLDRKVKKGTKETIIKFELENNGKFRWPENETFLLMEEANFTIKSQEIKLCSLNPGKKCSVCIKFNLDKLEKGIYINYLSFYAKGKKFGNNITINIEIL